MHKLIFKGKHPIKIAIVDDHVSTVTSISNFLEAYGFKTVWAYLGKDVPELCRRESPDLLILDINLEYTTGFDVARDLPKQKILFMTALDNMDSKIKNVKNSIGFIKKPIDNIHLMEIIMKEFDVKRKVIK